MGISRARLLFTTLDILPPSTNHMQKLTDKVSQAIIELNKKGMSDKLRIVEQHNAVAGQKNPKHISVSMDGRYNAHGFKSSYKPGQSSSQDYTVAMGKVTKEKYIIGLAMEKKLCWTGAWLQNRGFTMPWWACWVYIHSSIFTTTFRKKDMAGSFTGKFLDQDRHY